MTSQTTSSTIKTHENEDGDPLPSTRTTLRNTDIAYQCMAYLYISPSSVQSYTRQLPAIISTGIPGNLDHSNEDLKPLENPEVWRFDCLS